MTKKQKNAIILFCAAVYFISYFSRKDFAAAMAVMIEGGVLDKTTGGLVGMALFITYGAGQILSGWLGDRASPRLLLSAGVATTMLCNLFVPLLSPFRVPFILLWGLNGLAQAMLWPPIVRLLAEHLDERSYIRANLLVLAAAQIATILLYLYVPLCARVFTWQAVFYSAALLALFALLLLVVGLGMLLPAGGSEAPKPAAVSRTAAPVPYGRLLWRSGLLPVILSIIAMGFLRDGIETWLPTLYTEAFGESAGLSTLLAAILPMFSIVSIMLITPLHRTRFFRNEAGGACLLALAAAVLILPTYFLLGVGHTATNLLCLLLVALVCGCMHAINFLLISCLPRHFARYGRAATTSGFCNAFVYVGSAISMYGIPAFSEHLGWGATILSWLSVALFGALGAVLALRAYTRFTREDFHGDA